MWGRWKQRYMEKAQARADAIIAEANERERQAKAEYAEFAAANAGVSVGGPAGPTPPLDVSEGRPGFKDLLKHSVEQFRDVVGEMFDDRAGVIDPLGHDFQRPPEQAPEAERPGIAVRERAARDEARRPYLAPEAPAYAFTRVSTTGRDQLADVLARLRDTGLAARPDLVYGVYRVPDRFDLRTSSDDRAYAEWEILHAPADLPPAGDEVQLTAVPRDAHVVARAPGEPRVTDEDVVGTLLSRAHVGPEDCFALTRFVRFAQRPNDAQITWVAQVESGLALTRPSDALRAAQEELLSGEPLALPPRPALPFHAAVLDWEAVAAWTAPKREQPPRIPSPLPHLPASWQELLAAYLEVVGIAPADCFGAGPVRTTDGGLGDLSAAGLGTLTGQAKQPCADGQERTRLAAAEHVVIAYRDRAAYQEGRERWRAYQDEVLHARLDHLTGARPVIEADDHPTISALAEIAGFFDPVQSDIPFLWRRGGPPPLAPYCGRRRR